jgi:hypothetical protein
MMQRLASVGFPVLMIASSLAVTAFGSDSPDASAPPSATEWHKTMIHTPIGHTGCFEAEYPNTTWQEVPCAPAVDHGPMGVPPTVPAASVVDSGTPAPGFPAMGMGTAAPGYVGNGIGYVVSVLYPDDSAPRRRGKGAVMAT